MRRFERRSAETRRACRSRRSPRDLVAVDSRKTDVAQDDLRLESEGRLDALQPIRRHMNLVALQFEHVLEHGRRVLVVLDDQHATLGDVVQRARLHMDGLGRQRQRHDELRPLPLAFALRSDSAAVKLDQALHQRQPEAETAARTVKTRVRLHERLEHPVHEVGRDADAIVADADDGLVSPSLERHQHMTARVGELAGVPEQVSEHLRQSLSIAIHPDRLAGPLEVQSDSTLRQDGSLVLDRILNDLCEVQALPL